MNAFLKKQFCSSSVLFTLSLLAIATQASHRAEALTINRIFLPPDTSIPGPIPNLEAGDPSSNIAGGGNLQDIFNAAADSWEASILDDHTINIVYAWLDLRTLGLPANVRSIGGTFENSFPPNTGFVAFNNDPSVPWFLDSTPTSNEEYQVFESSTEDLGGGTINIGRVYTASVGDAVGRSDLLTSATNRIGAALGFISPFPAFGIPGNSQLTFPELVVTSPRPFPGTVIPTLDTPVGEGIDSAEIATAVLSQSVFGQPSLGQRKALSAVDVLAVAEVSNFESVNLNPGQTVPEPATVMGIILASGLGATTLRRKCVKV